MTITRSKLKKFNPYHHPNKKQAIIFSCFFAVVGAGIILYSFAATPVNAIQIDNGTCGHNSQLGSPNITSSQEPEFLLNGDGPGSTYVLSLNGNSTGFLTADANGNLCVPSPLTSGNELTTTGPYTLTGNELTPNARALTPFTFTVNFRTSFQLDDNLCGQYLQAGSDLAASGVSTPTFTGASDGPTTTYQLYIDGNPWNATVTINTQSGALCTSPSPPLANGPHVLTGNELSPNPSNPVHPFYFSVDTTPPAALSAPVLGTNTAQDQNANITNSTAPDIIGTAPPGKWVWLIKNGVQLAGQPADSSGQYSISPNSLPLGSNTLSVATKNEAGVLGIPSPTLTIDVVANIPPTVSITSPANGAVVNGSTTLTSNPTDSDGVPIWKVQYFVDGLSVGTSSTSPFSLTWDSSKFVTGSHAMTAIATDIYGNTSGPSAVTSLSVGTPVPYPLIPGTPSTPTPTNNSSPTWTWPASSDPAGGPGLSSTAPYTVEYSQAQDFTTGDTTVIASSNSFTAPNLTNGTWYMRVEATDNLGNHSAWSPIGKVVVNTALSTVSIDSPLNGAIVSGVIQINTTDIDPAGIQGVYLQINGVTNGVDTSTTTPPYYDFTWNSNSVVNGNNVIGIQTINKLGVKTFAQIIVNVQNGVTSSFTTPSITNITAPAYNQVNLTWSASTETGGSGVAGYYIIRSTTNLRSAGNTIATTSGTGTSYTDTSPNLGGNKTYYYWVLAFDSLGNLSSPSPSTNNSVTTPPQPNSIAPDPPTIVTSAAAGPNEVIVTWNPANDNSGQVVGYNIYYVGSTAPLNGNTLIPISTPNISYGDTGLTPNTSYSYYVEAVNAGGLSSGPSTSTTAITPLLPPTTTTVTGEVTSKAKPGGLVGVLVHTNKGGAGGEISANTDQNGNYTLVNIVPSAPHTYSFSLKGYKTVSVKKTYAIGTFNLNEVLKKKK